MNNGVSGSFAGLDRTRRCGVRAVVTLLAAATMIWAVAGPAALSVDAAGVPDRDSTSSVGCHHDPDRFDQDGRHCCRCCRRHTPPTPAPTSPPRKTPTPERTPPPVRTVIAGTPHPAATPSPPAPQPQQGPAGSRPPVLAPPALAVPVPVAQGVIATNPVSIYVVTLGGLLVAGAIAAAAIVFVRRSD